MKITNLQKLYEEAGAPKNKNTESGTTDQKSGQKLRPILYVLVRGIEELNNWKEKALGRCEAEKSALNYVFCQNRLGGCINHHLDELMRFEKNKI